MPKIDLTVTISVILALCSIFSSIITAIINNRHVAKMRKLELQQKHYEDTVLYKRKIFENYLRYSGKCISYATEETLHEYGEYYLLALMYSPNDLQSEMIRVNSLIRDHDWKQATSSYEKLIPMIRIELKKL